MLEGLKAQIAALAAADLSLDPAGLGPEIVELGRLLSALEAQHSRRLGAFDRAEGYADDQLTAAAWLRAQTTLSHSQTAAQTRVGRLRDKLPALAAVWDAGETTFAHLRAVSAGIRDLPADLWPEVDAALAVAARTMTAKELGCYLRQLAQALTPTPKPRDETRHQARRLSVATGFDGMTVLSGRLTPEVGEKLHAALSAASRPDTDDEEARLPNQRTADALETVLDTVLDTAALPADGGEKPHIVLGVDLDHLDRDRPAADEEHPQLRQPDATGRRRRCDGHRPGRPRFAWTGPTSTATARRLACDATLLPIYTRGGQPIDVGRRTRIIPTALRAFIVARDKTCRWPGCTMPPRWSQVHHSSTGPTADPPTAPT